MVEYETSLRKGTCIMKRLVLLLLLVGLLSIIAACGANNSEQENTNNQENTENGEGGMDVDVENNDEENVGTATLTEEEGGVLVNFKGENLPKGTHAFHIHEKGEC